MHAILSYLQAESTELLVTRRIASLQASDMYPCKKILTAAFEIGFVCKRIITCMARQELAVLN
jgi:hypothetical protein